MIKILILSNESGSGHKQTAKILTQALQQLNNIQIKTVSVFKELFIDLDYSAWLFGVSGEDIYNKVLLKNEASQAFYRVFFVTIYYLFVALRRKTLIKRLARFFDQEQPDLVISVIPLLNQHVGRILKDRSPFLILQTDLFEYEEKSAFWRFLMPPGTWFIDDKQTYMASGTENGYQQALRYNPDSDKVRQLSGTVIDPRFLQPARIDVKVERQNLGFDPDKPVGLFLYGGYAPDRLYKLAAQIKAGGTQFIFICGDNADLKKRLETLPTPYVKVVTGYTQDVAFYMRIADFVIGKPGPGVIMESITLGLPMVLDVSRVLLHEKDNVAWMESHGLGLKFTTAGQLQQCMQTLSVPENYQQFKQNTARFQNNALAEIIEFIGLIIDFQK